MSTLPYIPLAYRAVFLWLEPFFAFNGAIICHFRPHSFLNTMSATALYTPSSQVVFDQLSACYVLFAFNEAVVLRIAKDFKVWRAMFWGMLICDVLHITSSWDVMGLQLSTRPWAWRAEDATNMGMLYVFAAMRIAFLAGVGIRKGEMGKAKA